MSTAIGPAVKAQGRTPDGAHADDREWPIPAIHGVVRWRLVDLCQWVFEEFRIHVAPQTMSRELHAMDYRKLSARPRHYAQADTRRSTLVQSSHGMLSNLWGLP